MRARNRATPTGLAALACVVALLVGSPAMAWTPPLPAPDEILSIVIKPQAKQHPKFFTAERLLANLPRFVPATLGKPIGGKIWQQTGVIVLKDGSVLFWRSYRDDVLAIETGGEPLIYALDGIVPETD